MPKCFELWFVWFFEGLWFFKILSQLPFRQEGVVGGWWKNTKMFWTMIYLIFRRTMFFFKPLNFHFECSSFSQMGKIRVTAGTLSGKHWPQEWKLPKLETNIAADFLIRHLPSGNTHCEQNLSVYQDMWLDATGHQMWKLYDVKKKIFNEKDKAIQDAKLFDTMRNYFSSTSEYKKIWRSL